MNLVIVIPGIIIILLLFIGFTIFIIYFCKKRNEKIRLLQSNNPDHLIFITEEGIQIVSPGKDRADEPFYSITELKENNYRRPKRPSIKNSNRKSNLSANQRSSLILPLILLQRNNTSSIELNANKASKKYRENVEKENNSSLNSRSLEQQMYLSNLAK